MALMVGSLYDALRSANVDEAQARKAAEDVSDYDKRVNGLDGSFLRLEGKIDRIEQKVEGRFTLLQWMLGFVLAMNVALLFRAFG